MPALTHHRRGGRRPPLRLTVTCVLSAIAGALLLAPAGGQAARAPAIAPLQDTVTLLGSQTVRGKPSAGGRKVASVSARRPLTGAHTVLPMLAQIQDDHGKFWFKVRLPGRALGGATPPRTGWISASRTTRSTTPWHIVVSVGSRRVIAYRDGKRMRSFAAIVGAPSTPTPRGEYFVEENVGLSARRAGAPFALALSARSGVFQEFEGGPGQIAIHGINNIGGRLGTAVVARLRAPGHRQRHVARHAHEIGHAGHHQVGRRIGLPPACSPGGGPMDAQTRPRPFISSMRAMVATSCATFSVLAFTVTVTPMTHMRTSAPTARPDRSGRASIAWSSSTM